VVFLVADVLIDKSRVINAHQRVSSTGLDTPY